MEITAEMTVEEVVTRFPETVHIFYKYGLPCIACGEPVWGTIAENAKRYRVRNLSALLEELNRVRNRTDQ